MVALSPNITWVILLGLREKKMIYLIPLIIAAFFLNENRIMDIALIAYCFYTRKDVSNKIIIALLIFVYVFIPIRVMPIQIEYMKIITEYNSSLHYSNQTGYLWQQIFKYSK